MRNLDPNQFKLFMTGTEWKAQITHSTDGPMPALWEQKSGEAKARGVYTSMRNEGYQHTEPRPTIVIEDSPNGKTTRMVQSEGHHRVAAAADVEKDTGKPVFIPTNYVDNTAAGRRARHGYRQ